MASRGLPQVGQEIGGYRIVAEIGRGGMAVVFKALHVKLNRHVALKVLLPHLATSPEFVQRFQREARAAASLRHPNIVTVYDIGRDRGFYYMAMEYIEGESLRDLLARRKRLTPREALPLLQQIASALDYAHSKGFVHRDVKPSNVLIERRTGRAVLTDFGVVKALRERAHITQTGSFIGTVHYAAPEQVRGERIDHRVDLYALGVICYEMLTGRPPFVGNTAEVLAAHIQKPAPPIHRQMSGLPPGVDTVLQRMLAKRPGDRYNTAAAFVADLQRAFAGQRIRPSSKRAATPPPKHTRGTSIGAVGGLILAVSILAFHGVLLAAMRGDNRSQDGGARSSIVRTYEITTEVPIAPPAVPTVRPPTAPSTDLQMTEQIRQATLRAQTAEAATRAAQRTLTAEAASRVAWRTLTAEAAAHLTATRISADATRRAKATEQAMNATATAVAARGTATAAAHLTQTAIALMPHCFEARFRQKEPITGPPGRFVGQVAGIVYDRNKQPFTKARIHLYIAESNWETYIPINPDGIYDFCCLGLNPQNLHVVEIVGERVRSLNDYRFRVDTPQEGRVLVDFYEVSCP